MEQRHLVQKYTFDVEYDSESKAFQFQNQLAAFVKDKVLRLTDEVFTEVSVNNDIGIQKLVIDLGEISIDQFEEQLFARLKSRLSDKLHLLLSGVGITLPEEQIEFISKTQTDLSIVEYFLNQGTLPWSARKSDPDFSIQKTIIRCLEEKPAEVKRIVSSGVSKEEVRLRIIRQLEDVVLWKIVRIWAESETVKIQKVYTDLISVYSKRPLIKNHFAEYREMVWAFILSEVIVVQKFKETIPEFIENFFEFVAKENQAPLENIIKVFYAAIAQEASKSNDSISVESIGVISTIDYQTKFPEAVLELSRKHTRRASDTELGSKSKERDLKARGSETSDSKTEDPLGRSVQPVFSDSESEQKKQDRKKFEEYRQEQIKKREIFILSFLKVVALISDRKELKSEIEKVESIIKEMVVSNPVFLKKAFEDAKFTIKELPAQLVLDLFTEEVAGLIAQEIFKIEKKKLFSMKAEASRKAVISFIETGYYPYSALPLFFTKVDFENLMKEVFEKEEEKVISKLIRKNIVSASDKPFKIAQLQKHLTSKFLKKYFSSYPEILEKKTSVEGKSNEAQIPKLSDLRSMDQMVYIIQYIVKEKSLPPKAEYTVTQVIDKFLSEYKAIASAYLTSLKEKEFSILQKVVSAATAKKLVEHREELRKTVKDIQEAELPSIADVAEDINEPDEKKPFKKLETGEPVYINNAGLVIFHPYLSRFFNMFNLLDKRAFKDEVASHKAVYLLQYLVNKSLDSEEHDLVLNKLLCGIDLQTPLLRDIEITEEDKTICEGLIEGVIQNWPVLKKTSNDNFRSSFVMREGRLLQENKDWRLKVEERGYDILVEKLPWSVSMIKLPWMNHMIYVEWK